MANALDLITAGNYKTRYEIADTDTARDNALALAITDASRTIMDEVRREFAPAVASAKRRFALGWHPEFGWWLDFDSFQGPCDCRSVSAVTVDPDDTATVVVSSDWKLLPVGGDCQDGSGNAIFTELQLSSYLAMTPTSLFKFGTIEIDVTGAWGFAAVPEDVQEACFITVREWMHNGAPADNTYWQDAREGQPIAPASWGIPPAALRKLSNWRKNGGAGA